MARPRGPLFAGATTLESGRGRNCENPGALTHFGLRSRPTDWITSKPRQQCRGFFDWQRFLICSVCHRFFLPRWQMAEPAWTSVVVRAHRVLFAYTASKSRQWGSTHRPQGRATNIELENFLLRFWRQPLLVCAYASRRIELHQPIGCTRRPSFPRQWSQHNEVEGRFLLRANNLNVGKSTRLITHSQVPPPRV